MKTDDSMVEQVLVVEDEELLRDALLEYLDELGYKVYLARNLAEARRHLEAIAPDLVLLDLNLPDGSGIEILENLEKSVLSPTVVVLTADTSLETAVEAVRAGAYDYLVKPFKLATLRQRIRGALERRRHELEKVVAMRLGRKQATAWEGIRPVSRAMNRLLRKVDRVAKHDQIPILVTGETGVGKEYICRLIHDLSDRASEPFVAINCGELDRNLLRSELFGHERGAFTGAHERRPGIFEQASRGTLMLDEIGDMPLEVQAAFLRVLEDGTYRRLGSTVERKTAARIIAATNCNLSTAVKNGAFRQDVLYRLNTVEIHVPPLRERQADIVLFAKNFCETAAYLAGVELSFSDAAIKELKGYEWPGNVRELRNVVERTVLLCDNDVIQAQDVVWSAAQNRQQQLKANPLSAQVPSGTGEPGDADSFPTLAEMEMRHIDRALAYSSGNHTLAAKALGISRSTLLRKLKKQ